MSFFAPVLPGQGAPPAQVTNVPSLDPTTVINAQMPWMNQNFQNQDKALAERMGAMGMDVGQPAIDAQMDLGSSQQTQFANQVQPYVWQGLQGNQQTALNAGEFNASQQNAKQQADAQQMIQAALAMYGMQNADWQQLAQQQYGFGQQFASAYTPTFQQGGQPNYGGLGAAMAGNSQSPNFFSGQPSSTPYFGGADFMAGNP